MNADIITDDAFPHGTPGGYTAGCRGSHCPAPMSCRDVHCRYSGDWSFRKRIDAGVTPQEILAEEAAQARLARETALAEKRRQPRPKASTGDRRAAANRARAAGAIVIPRDKLRELHSKGWTDRQIADELGYTRRQVTGVRNAERLPLNPDPNRRPINDQAPTPSGLSSSQGHGGGA